MRPQEPAAAAMPREPVRRLVIVTCMDGRIEPVAALGLKLGDAAVLRNAGAMVTDDVVRSLEIAHRVLGAREAIVMGHTECAAYDDAGRDAGSRAGAVEGARRIRRSRALPDSFGVRTCMYDVRTGHVESIA